MPPLWKMLGVKPPTSQDKLKQLHSQCQKKKSGSLFLTLCHLVIIYKCYSHQTFVNSSLRICLLDFGFVFEWPHYRVLWGEGEGVWEALDISWKHGIRHSCHDYFCHQTIYYWCAKVLKSFFWVMPFLYCLRKDPRIPCAGLTKVAGCWWKSPPTWLVSASYSAWHFFTDGIF